MGEPSIRSYHAHLYFRTPEERERALAVREQIETRFTVQLGRVHDRTVGPHPEPMYQVAFEPAQLAPFLSWLMLNRAGLSVLVHPNTGRARDDHLHHALWLGAPLPLRGDVLSNDDAPISPVIANTRPQPAS
jgi:aromatic ring-cleaving dioxygenase